MSPFAGYRSGMLRFCPSVILAAAAFCAEPPTNWIDPDTGHRIVRLTKEPGSASLYFNQNGYTADGKKMVYTTPDGISVLELKTLAAKPVVQGREGLEFKHGKSIRCGVDHLLAVGRVTIL